MQRLFLLTCGLGLLAAASAQAGVDLRSGTWLMRGGSVVSDAFATSTTNAALRGNGSIVAPVIALAGTVAPSGEYDAETGTLQFDGPVALNGLYLCKANGHADVDLLTASGAVTGHGLIQVFTNSGAIPLDQVIIAGAPASEYTGSAPVAAQTALFRLTDDAAGNLRLTDLRGDSNTNGLPDWWEARYFGGRTNADPGADNDDDNAFNLHEYGAGTDPTNGASFFALARIAPASGAILVEWHSVTGKAYTVEEVLGQPDAVSYSVIASNVAAVPPLNTWTNPGGASGPCFYRISIAR